MTEHVHRKWLPPYIVCAVTPAGGEGNLVRCILTVGVSGLLTVSMARVIYNGIVVICVAHQGVS